MHTISANQIQHFSHLLWAIIKIRWQLRWHFHVTRNTLLAILVFFFLLFLIVLAAAYLHFVYSWGITLVAVVLLPVFSSCL